MCVFFQVRSIVLLNCGATVELQRFFEVPESTKIFVIDSHRPYHLANVKDSNEQVCRLFSVLGIHGRRD